MFPTHIIVNYSLPFPKEGCKATRRSKMPNTSLPVQFAFVTKSDIGTLTASRQPQLTKGGFSSIFLRLQACTEKSFFSYSCTDDFLN